MSTYMSEISDRNEVDEIQNNTAKSIILCAHGVPVHDVKISNILNMQLMIKLTFLTQGLSL